MKWHLFCRHELFITDVRHLYIVECFLITSWTTYISWSKLLHLMNYKRLFGMTNLCRVIKLLFPFLLYYCKKWMLKANCLQWCILFILFHLVFPITHCSEQQYGGYVDNMQIILAALLPFTQLFVICRKKNEYLNKWRRWTFCPCSAITC